VRIEASFRSSGSAAKVLRSLVRFEGHDKSGRFAERLGCSRNPLQAVAIVVQDKSISYERLELKIGSRFTGRTR